MVILFTSSSRPEHVERAYELGVNSYVLKPMSHVQGVELAQLLKGWWLGHNHCAALNGSA